MMRVASTDGVSLAVHDLGGHGHEFLVSHATGFHGRCYEPLADELARRSDHPFHSIAFDYRGHGDTPQPDAAVDWQRYGDDAEAMAAWMVERTGAPVDGFGHSMGGACLLMAAARRPTLFRRLVVFEPIVFPPTDSRSEEQAEQNPLAVGARRRRAVFASHRAAIENFAGKPPLNLFTPAALEAYVVHGFAPDPEGVRLKCSPETEAATFAMGSRHDTWERLARIETPTLVVAGVVQPMQPSSIARDIADRLPNATYLELDHMSHFGPMTHPAEMADVIARFLAD